MATYPKSLGRAATIDDAVYYLESQFAGTQSAAETAEDMLAVDDLPDAAGTYILTCTVTEGTGGALSYAYSWESVGS